MISSGCFMRGIRFYFNKACWIAVTNPGLTLAIVKEIRSREQVICQGQLMKSRSRIFSCRSNLTRIRCQNHRSFESTSALFQDYFFTEGLRSLQYQDSGCVLQRLLGSCQWEIKSNSACSSKERVTIDHPVHLELWAPCSWASWSAFLSWAYFYELSSFSFNVFTRTLIRYGAKSYGRIFHHHFMNFILIFDLGFRSRSGILTSPLADVVCNFHSGLNRDGNSTAATFCLKSKKPSVEVRLNQLSDQFL